MNTVLFYVVEFFFYSAAGWLIESLYCSIGEGRIINRGFLTGPMCPIYGTAALVMTGLAKGITARLRLNDFAASFLIFVIVLLNVRGFRGQEL